MKTYYKTIDGMVYLNVDKKAQKLWDSKTFDMYVIWEKGTTTYRLPLIDDAEFKFAIQQQGKAICIEIGREDEIMHALSMSRLSWSNAETIIHNGYVYVRYNDLVE